VNHKERQNFSRHTFNWWFNRCKPFRQLHGLWLFTLGQSTVSLSTGGYRPH